MSPFEIGDRIRIDVPNESDPDFDLHGQHGEIVNKLNDDASDITGIDADDDLYRVKLDDGTVHDVRGRDVRPPIDDNTD